MEHQNSNFNILTELTQLISKEIFVNAAGAIIELVKNTYDADSKVCFVVFDIREDKRASSIYIIDQGEGMTEDVISRHWMTISDDKLNDAFSKNGRVKSNAKEIGSFALNRLGKKAEIITFSEKTRRGLRWTIDWIDFEKEDYTLFDINASLDSIDYVELRERIEGFGLNHFDVLSNLFSNDYKGTIIKISDLNDDWDENQLRSLNTNLENLFLPHLVSDFEIFLYSFAGSELYGKVKKVNYNDFGYRGDMNDNAKEISSRVNEVSMNIGKDKSDSFNPTDEVLLTSSPSSFKCELSSKEDQIRLIRGFASSGIVIESFTHELKGISNRLLCRTEMLVESLKEYIRSDRLKGVDKYDNPYYHIELIRKEDNVLCQWLNFTLNTVEKEKRERHNIVISDYFTRFKQTWNETLKRKSINLYLKGDAQSQDCVSGFEIDLDSIFNNFVINSVESLLRTPINDKQITISWKSDHGYVVIDFEDNGRGLAKEYKAKPEVIFDAFETSMVNWYGEKIGTGMGLSIVKGIIDSYKGSSINITKIDNGFGLRVIFKCSNYGEKQ